MGVLLPKTTQRLQALATSSSSGRLSISEYKLRLLEEYGLWDGISGLNNWDDEYNDSVPNGQNRTVLQVMLDCLNAMLGDPLGRLAEKGCDPQDYIDRRIIWLAGKPFTGKTHLAKLTALLWCAYTERLGTFVVWSDKVGQIIDGYNGAERANWSLERRMGILVIDDLMLAKWSVWRAETLFRLLEARRFFPTIITSNVTVETFLRGAITSRIRNDDASALKLLVDRIKSRLQTGRRLLVEVKVSSKHGEYHTNWRDSSNGTT